MSANVLAILTTILELVPLAVKGSAVAWEAYEAGLAVFRTITDEGRDPTEDEAAAVRKMREDAYADFYADDEAAADPAP